MEPSLRVPWDPERDEASPGVGRSLAVVPLHIMDDFMGSFTRRERHHKRPVVAEEVPVKKGQVPGVLVSPADECEVMVQPLEFILPATVTTNYAQVKQVLEDPAFQENLKRSLEQMMEHVSQVLKAKFTELAGISEEQLDVQMGCLSIVLPESSEDSTARVTLKEKKEENLETTDTKWIKRQLDEEEERDRHSITSSPREKTPSTAGTSVDNAESEASIGQGTSHSGEGAGSGENGVNDWRTVGKKTVRNSKGKKKKSKKEKVYEVCALEMVGGEPVKQVAATPTPVHRPAAITYANVIRLSPHQRPPPKGRMNEPRREVPPRIGPCFETSSSAMCEETVLE